MHEVTQSRADTMAQQYLDQLTRFLHALPERDRSDAVREIASHIAESHAAGQPVAVVLAGLGDPRVLARAYLADYYGQQPPGTRWQLWLHRLAGLGFVLGSGVTSLVVVPVLSVLTLTLGLAAPVTADPFFFSTGNPDGKMATASRPESAGKHFFDRVFAPHPIRGSFNPGLAQGLGLRLAARFGQSGGEVREQHGEKQPRVQRDEIRDRHLAHRFAHRGLDHEQQG